MVRYFFDMRYDDDLAPDEEGLVLPSVEAAQDEAAISLAEMARDVVQNDRCRRMAIEVRTLDTPVLEVVFQWHVQRKL
ncbi:DUF6894 family protein [Bradyrhizobium genosp. P]|uniref:DUF6894 family protein n=1 Tax=Bradyrhizobium genosp. P TaxID=83641 RepID=UPI003CEBF128